MQQARLLEDLDKAIEDVRNGRPGMALLLVGIGRMNFINWNLGFAGGDAVMENVILRLTDGFPDFPVYTLWAGKFGILAQCGDTADAMHLAHRIVALCSVPHRIGASEVFSPPFVGVAVVQPGYPNGGALLQDALFAMEDARLSYLGSARLYDPERKKCIERAFQLENGMRAAFETGNQFSVVYQPLVALGDPGNLHLMGFEALLRWRHPQFGPVPPDHFIPVSEECGLILGLGSYVLWEACRQQVDWTRACGRPMTMSVNLSPVQLMAPEIEDTITEAIAGTGIDPHYLKLEVTETALATDLNSLAEKLGRLREIGVSVGVDDFGSGYSSLGQLDLFGLDFMKIDKSLVQRIGPSGRQTELVRLTIALAKHLGMVVVAEGIEDQSHLETLMALGADVGQGYLFDRPLPPHEAARWLTPGTWSPEG
jgi:FOG: EAL domain